MSQYNLRHYLEGQSDRTEAVLAAHNAPARITGGTIGPRLIRLFLNPAPHTCFSTIQGLTDDLALALRAPALRIGRGEEGVILELPNPHPRPVTLLKLLPEIAPLPPLTVVLGLTDAGVPLLARLSSPDVGHVLVSGAAGSGKSALLRTMAVSLILAQPAADLRLLCLDPRGRIFGSLADAPHLLRPPVSEIHEAREALRSLLRELELRDRRGENLPTIVLLVDELLELVTQGGSSLTQALTQLVQWGREAGIHVVAATQRPSSAILSGLLQTNFPLRLVGKAVSAEKAWVAAGRDQVDAQTFSGQGDFLAVSGHALPIRFQAAFIEERDARKEIAAIWELR